MQPAVSLVTRSPMERRAFHEPAPTAERLSLLSRASVVPLACASCALATAAYIVADDPGDGDRGLIPCPIRALTGQWCPGCGLTRATHHLFRGNVGQALSFNLFVPLVLVALVAMWAVWLSVVARRGVPRWVMSLGLRSYVAIGAALTAFTVIRNLAPFGVLRGT